jgi:hypothetical protein
MVYHSLYSQEVAQGQTMKALNAPMNLVLIVNKGIYPLVKLTERHVYKGLKPVVETNSTISWTHPKALVKNKKAREVSSLLSCLI